MFRSTQELRTSTDLISIISSLRTRSISSVPDNMWKEMLNEQDYDNYIFEIREELLSKVFDEIQKKFLDKQRVKFVVECTYESLKQIICLNFFFHDSCNKYYRKQSSWSRDPEPAPCQPDSWSRGNISMKKRELKLLKPPKIDTVLSDYQLIKLEDYPQENRYGFIKETEETTGSEMIMSSLQQLYVEDTGRPSFRSPIMSVSPAESEYFPEDMIINRIISEHYVSPVQSSDHLFYKKLKRKEISLPSIESIDLKITPQKQLPSYPADDNVKKLSFPPLRLTVASTIRASFELPDMKNRKHGSSRGSKSVNFPKDVHDEMSHVSSSNFSEPVTPPP